MISSSNHCIVRRLAASPRLSSLERFAQRRDRRHRDSINGRHRRTSTAPPSPSSPPAHSIPVPQTVLPSDCTQLDISSALRPHFASQTPVLLRRPLGSCDAVYLWRSFEYLRLAVGDDVPVNVEIGQGTYADPDILRPSIPFGEYVKYLELFEEKEERRRSGGGDQDDDGAETKDDLVYLAQNDLFPQIAADVPIPDLCSDPAHFCGEGRPYSTKIWMGPRGTVSPMHYDPLDNLFMQIVGTKSVLLYPASNDDEDHRRRSSDEGGKADSWHYAGCDGNQYNTSPVDVESPDLSRYPLFAAKAPTPYGCTLGPGDVLYIPKRWWHHVRALQTSVSVNAWWR